jgi:hypothetical protein
MLATRNRGHSVSVAVGKVLSSYRPHSMRIADTGTMRSRICPSSACLRSYLEAGYFVPDLESVHTCPTVVLGS